MSPSGQARGGLPPGMAFFSEQAVIVRGPVPGTEGEFQVLTPSGWLPCVPGPHLDGVRDEDVWEVCDRNGVAPNAPTVMSAGAGG